MLFRFYVDGPSRGAGFSSGGLWVTSEFVFWFKFFFKSYDDLKK